MCDVAIADDVDVWRADFSATCAVHGLELPTLDPARAEISEASAAQFVVAVWRSSRWLRWRFPRALTDGEGGGFARWMKTRGRRRFRLSLLASKKIAGAFRRSPGERIREIYLQDRELQRMFPLGLAPPGQRHFLGWLTTFGRSDQQVQDYEVIWFLHAASESVGDGIGLSFRVNRDWQVRFPNALTRAGWQSFCDALLAEYPALHRWRRQLRKPPREPVPDAAAAGVNILSHFCYPSGIQQAAMWTKVALERAGLVTSCRDVPAGIKTTLSPRKDWLGLEVFPITVITVAPTPYFTTAYERSGWYRRPGVYRIAYWAWELETIPEEWVAMLPLLDEIWTPTEFVAAAMRTRMDVPVHRMLPGVKVPNVEPVSKTDLGIPEDHCVFLFMFDMFSAFERKNPLAVIRAFRQAFRRQEKATLLLKTTASSPNRDDAERLQAAADDAGILLITQLLSREQAYGYLAMCDCYVSLHRSEGFGLGMAEAMLLGKPVIATGYSGNRDFMHEHNSYLVDFEMAEVQEAGPIYTRGARWAEPSVDHAAKLMRQVFDNQADAKALGARAQAELREKLSLRAAGERMAARLREIDSRAR
ncbi:MAG: glycosyltransferase family 4 protein [Chthoniobacterales bacterium]